MTLIQVLSLILFIVLIARAIYLITVKGYEFALLFIAIAFIIYTLVPFYGNL